MVAILMSTYNGERFLREQIDSILCQTFEDYTLYIRDDGSSDGTVSLVRSYQDPRIRLIQGRNMGPAGSFFALLNEAQEADYIFFSDQDDVWYPDKLERMLDQIRQYENVPAMVFSDFSMIDENGSQTHPSYANYASLQVAAGGVGVEKLIAQPYVFGCASVINRKLADLVQDPPDGIEMHDCWISLTAAAVGKLIYMPEQTIAHRFHSSNATGKQEQDSKRSRLDRLTRGFSNQAENSALRLHQVNLLLDVYGQMIEPSVYGVLKEISDAMSSGKISTIRALHTHGVGRQKKMNTWFFYLTIIGIKGEIR